MRKYRNLKFNLQPKRITKYSEEYLQYRQSRGSMSVKQELCDTDADGFEDAIVSDYRSPAAGKVAVCDVVTESPVDTPIPVLGPSNLTNEVVAPALGPVDVASDLAPAYNGPYNLSASVVAPALGPSIVQSSIAVSSAGPSNISASIAAPALGPANLAEVTGVSELTPRETLVGDLVGQEWGSDFAVNENGDRMIVGVYRMDPNAWGGAKVYELQESGWVQMGSDIEGMAIYAGNVGYSVDMNSTGDRVIVGSFRTGTIAAYEWDGSDWTMMGNRVDGGIENLFGNIVKINSTGTIIATGAINSDISDSFDDSNVGAIKLYEWNGSDWAQKGSTITGNRHNHQVGEAFDINDTGDRVAVADNGSGYDNVIVYEWDGNNWAQLGQTISETGMYTIGDSVTMNKAGNRIAVPEVLYNTDKIGAVYVYEFNGATWELMGTPIEGLEVDGLSGDPEVALNDAGDRISIPTWRREDENGNETGLLSVYAWDGTEWKILHQNYAMTGEDRTRYSYVTHLNGSGLKVFTSAPWLTNESGERVGKIYSYDLPTTIPNIVQKPVSGPAALSSEVDLGMIERFGIQTISPDIGSNYPVKYGGMYVWNAATESYEDLHPSGTTYFKQNESDIWVYYGESGDVSLTTSTIIQEQMGNGWSFQGITYS